VSFCFHGMFWDLSKGPSQKMSDRFRWGDDSPGGAAHETPGHAAPFINQKLRAANGSQPYCLGLLNYETSNVLHIGVALCRVVRRLSQG
jgi:hypothetical protein